MSKAIELAPTHADVLLALGRCDCMPDTAPFWNSARRQAVGRLLKKNFCERTDTRKGPGYRITQLGSETLRLYRHRTAGDSRASNGSLSP